MLFAHRNFDTSSHTKQNNLNRSLAVLGVCDVLSLLCLRRSQKRQSKAVLCKKNCLARARGFQSSSTKQKSPPLHIFQNFSVLNPKVHTSLAPHLASSPSPGWPRAGASASAGVWHPRRPKRCSSGRWDAAAGPCCCRCAPGPAATCASPRPRSRWSPELRWEMGCWGKCHLHKESTNQH